MYYRFRARKAQTGKSTTASVHAQASKAGSLEAGKLLLVFLLLLLLLCCRSVLGAGGRGGIPETPRVFPQKLLVFCFSLCVVGFCDYPQKIHDSLACIEEFRV